MSSTFDYTRVNAIGATVLSILTIIGGVYLLVALLLQGRGKLRVRLLLGMVLSDIALGLIVLPPEVMYVAGQPLVTGTAGCDALGFLLTMALFTQHLWTLLMAIATFLLLKYPLSRATTFIERYSWASFPVILGVSALHSGLWYRYYGFMSAGNLCYYGGDSADVIPDARDLIQFIPRAITFLTVAVLYSMLYRFLRRPDTINVPSMVSRPGSVHEKEAGNGALLRLAKRIRRKDEDRDDRPPWEKMEFVQVGNRRWEDELQIPDPQPSSSGLLVSRSLTFDATGSRGDLPSLEARSSVSSKGTDREWAQQRGSDAETLVTPTMQSDLIVPHALSPILSEGKGRIESLGIDEEQDDYGGGKHGETLGEFFQEYQVTINRGQAEQGVGSGGRQISAAAYFNRQASLLMLYFPLAYVIVFSASLVRLIYDMTTNGTPSPVLTIVSAWFTLSVGVLDALVYGLAEFIVKRKVRRKMPDRI